MRLPPHTRGEGAKEAAFVGPVFRDTDAFDAAFAGQSCQIVRPDGTTEALSTHRWQGDVTPSDLALFVEPCHGATLDIGCGPGRLAGALAARGIEVLGIDTSVEAVRLTLARGAMALRRDVFETDAHRVPVEPRTARRRKHRVGRRPDHDSSGASGSSWTRTARCSSSWRRRA